MKETPKRVSTVPLDELKDKSAPAWIEVGLDVNGKVRDVEFELMVIVVDDDAEDWNVPESTTVCLFDEEGGKKS